MVLLVACVRCVWVRGVHSSVCAVVCVAVCVEVRQRSEGTSLQRPWGPGISRFTVAAHMVYGGSTRLFHQVGGWCTVPLAIEAIYHDNRIIHVVVVARAAAGHQLQGLRSMVVPWSHGITVLGMSH